MASVTPSALSKAEISYIRASLTSEPPLRADGRGLFAFRNIALETGVAPLANGSARISLGGTEVLAAVKLEVDNVSDSDDTGRISVNVSCTPASHPHMSSAAIDDLSLDLSSILQTTLAHPTLHPKNLSILPRSKAWLLHLDLLVLSDRGNILDALFLATHAALRDTRVPRTRAISFRTDKENIENSSGLDTRQVSRATDFEVPDYWDEGELLDAHGCWPIAITLNVIDPSHFFLDASASEEIAVPIRLLLVISYHQSSTVEGVLQAMRLLGPAELETGQIQDLVKNGELFARQLYSGLDAKLQEETHRRGQKAIKTFEATQIR